MTGQGHNSKVSFEAVVEEMMRHGLWLSQRNVMIAATRDPRVKMKHMRVLAEIMEHTNSKTGVSYPGRKALSESTRYVAGGIEDAGGPYSESTIAKIISELLTWGYLVTIRRAPAEGRRALAHYVTAMPPIDTLQAEIAVYFEQQRRRGPRPAPNIQQNLGLPDPGDCPHPANATTSVVPDGGNVQAGGNVPGRENVSSSVVPDGENIKSIPDVPELAADVPASRAADVPSVDPTVTGRGTSSGTAAAADASDKPASLGKPDPIDGLGETSKGLMDLIAQHTGMQGGDAVHHLRETCNIYGADSVREAYLKAKSGGIRGNAWKYLLKVAGNLKREAALPATGFETGSHSSTSATPTPLSGGDRLMRAMRQAYPIGDTAARPWPADVFGPAPGQPGCKLSIDDQEAVWRDLLARVRSDVPNWQGYPPDRLGYAICNRVRMWWEVDSTAPDCPIPHTILQEFGLPLTRDGFDAVRARYATQPAWMAPGSASVRAVSAGTVSVRSRVVAGAESFCHTSP